MRKEIYCSQITGFKGGTGHRENHSKGKIDRILNGVQ